MGATKDTSSSSSRPALELTIISGESLTMSGKRSIKKSTFVVVKNESDNSLGATRMDTQNGSCPSWGDKFFIDIPMHNYFTLEVHCNNNSGDYVVGSVRVPTSDFMGGYFPSNYLHFLSYRLKDRFGYRNGIINLSIKMKSSGYDIAGTSSCKSSSQPTRWNYDAASNKKMNQGVSDDGIVMGIPVGKQC
uniref:BON1-associated protein 2 n=1 Tax=Erigeron canadensis TaxID=72917 RepID=UPI001CB8DFDE|nr:BON1-associated protein 2 [Erigeron canadensis]